MKDKNTIRSLHRTDDATAEAIMQAYPAQWDMDRVFRKAYQGYLAQKKEITPVYSELKETVEYTAENRTARSLRRIGGYAGLAAAMIGAFLMIFHSSVLHRPEGRLPEETSILTVTQPETEDTTTESSTASASAEASCAPETTADEASTTETAQVTETDVSETELPVSEIVMPVGTEPPAAETTTTEPVQETTTEATATIPPEHLQGHFVFNGIDGVTLQISFVRESTEPIVPKRHSFAAEGFTVTDMQEKDPDEVSHYILYDVESEAGQQYQVQQFSNLRVVYVLEPDGDMMTKSYEIDGKPAYLVYQTDDPDADCELMWFDGCHICFVKSPLKNLADMELLVQSQITYD